jgi:hypothetical protein
MSRRATADKTEAPRKTCTHDRRQEVADPELTLPAPMHCGKPASTVTYLAKPGRRPQIWPFADV